MCIGTKCLISYNPIYLKMCYFEKTISLKFPSSFLANSRRQSSPQRDISTRNRIVRCTDNVELPIPDCHRVGTFFLLNRSGKCSLDNTTNVFKDSHLKRYVSDKPYDIINTIQKNPSTFKSGAIDSPKNWLMYIYQGSV